MHANFSTRIIQQTLKCIPFFIALFLIFSCDSRLENLKDKNLRDQIYSLEASIDELNQKVDSLNLRILQLEPGAIDDDLVNEMRSEGPPTNRQIICPNCSGEGTKRETCYKCHGSGWDPRSKGKACSNCDYTLSSSAEPGKGYYNETCSVCHGKGRIYEYE
jgi:hypothetical protein